MSQDIDLIVAERTQFAIDQHETRYHGSGPPPDPPDPPPPDPPDPPDPPGPDPEEFPWWNGEGQVVKRAGRTWITRNKDKLRQVSPTEISNKVRNTSCTLLIPEIPGTVARGCRTGGVAFDMCLSQNFLTSGTGGKHLFQVKTTGIVGGGPNSGGIPDVHRLRVELANPADRPRILVWNYGPSHNGRPRAEAYLPEAFQSNRWYPVSINWSMAGQGSSFFFEVVVDGQSTFAECQLAPDTIGPLYFSLGHMEGLPSGVSMWKNIRFAGN